MNLISLNGQTARHTDADLFPGCDMLYFTLSLTQKWK